MGPSKPAALKGINPMPRPPRTRWLPRFRMTGMIGRMIAFIVLALILDCFYLWHRRVVYIDIARPAEDWTPRDNNADFWYLNVPVHYPVSSYRPLLIGPAVQFPRIQAAEFPAEQHDDTRARREKRQQTVKRIFAKQWREFKKGAWGTSAPAFEEHRSVEFGAYSNQQHGWGETLLVALDTLWLMDMKDEFEEAVAAVYSLDFSLVGSFRIVSVGGTNARFLGALLAAYDLSGDVRLLRKAVELGDMLYKAFDTPNRMPSMWWNANKAMLGEEQVAVNGENINDMGGMTLEFTRLSLLTGHPKWFDAVQRVAEALAAHQNLTRLPGLWPWFGNADEMIFNDHHYAGLVAVPTMAAALAKTVAMVGADDPLYQRMYEEAMDAAAKWTWFRPMTPTNEDILMARIIKQTVMTEVQSSSCALGASMALGSRVFGREQDWHAATRLVEGCIWLCKAWNHGTMPFISTLMECPSTDGCPWDEEAWREEVVLAAQDDRAIKTEVSHGPVDALIEAERLPKGLVPITRGRYGLQHEAIEGVFVLYRMTGRPDLLETAWDMFAAINRTWGPAVDPPREYDATHKIPQAADLLNPSWLGPTLRYFYLVFSDPGLASLDDYVFNEQAHPIRRVGRY